MSNIENPKQFSQRSNDRNNAGFLAIRTWSLFLDSDFGFRIYSSFDLRLNQRRFFFGSSAAGISFSFAFGSSRFVSFGFGSAFGSFFFDFFTSIGFSSTITAASTHSTNAIEAESLLR